MIKEHFKCFENLKNAQELTWGVEVKLEITIHTMFQMFD